MGMMVAGSSLSCCFFLPPVVLPRLLFFSRVLLPLAFKENAPWDDLSFGFPPSFRPSFSHLFPGFSVDDLSPWSFYVGVFPRSPSRVFSRPSKGDLELL